MTRREAVNVPNRPAIARSAVQPRKPDTRASFPATCDDNGCILEMTPAAYLLNNLWNIGGAQGIQAITAHSPTSWSTEWDWETAAEWSVLTYASMVLGWQWGWHVPPAQTGLPIRLDSPTPVGVEVAFEMAPQTGCRWDVAFDMWLHDTPDQSGSLYELMVWLHYERNLWVGQMPVAAGVELAGHRWKLYDTGVLAWVIDEPDLSEFQGDLREFTDWVVQNRGWPATRYLSSVQFGPEIYKGAGTLDVSHYVVQVGGIVPEPEPEPGPDETTLRDMFAAAAIAGVARADYSTDEQNRIIDRAWDWADRMLDARDETSV